MANKADQPGSSDTRRDLDLMLDLSHISGAEDPDYRPPIIMTNALTGDGVAEVLTAINTHHKYLDAKGQRSLRRERRAQSEIASRVAASFDAQLRAAICQPSLRRLIQDVANGEISTVSAATRLSAAVLAMSSDETAASLLTTNPETTTT